MSGVRLAAFAAALLLPLLTAPVYGQGLTIEVYGPDGQPIFGQEVRAISLESGRNYVSSTGPDGVARIQVPPEEHYQVSVSHRDGYATAFTSPSNKRRGRVVFNTSAFPPGDTYIGPYYGTSIGNLISQYGAATERAFRAGEAEDGERRARGLERAQSETFVNGVRLAEMESAVVDNILSGLPELQRTQLKSELAAAKTPADKSKIVDRALSQLEKEIEFLTRHSGSIDEVARRTLVDTEIPLFRLRTFFRIQASNELRGAAVREALDKIKPLRAAGSDADKQSAVPQDQRPGSQTSGMAGRPGDSLFALGNFSFKWSGAYANTASPDIPLFPLFQGGNPTGGFLTNLDTETTGARWRFGVGWSAPAPLRIGGFDVQWGLGLAGEFLSSDTSAQAGQIQIPQGQAANLVSVDGRNVFNLNNLQSFNFRYDYDYHRIAATVRARVPVTPSVTFNSALLLGYRGVDTTSHINFLNFNVANTIDTSLDYSGFEFRFSGGVTWRPRNDLDLSISGNFGFWNYDADLSATQRVGNAVFNASASRSATSLIYGAGARLNYRPWGSRHSSIGAFFAYERIDCVPFAQYPVALNQSTAIGFGSQDRIVAGVKLRLTFGDVAGMFGLGM